eukprot:scaffold1336_cov100-Skeletonema_dohrnii-CCMP3373.AAC.12
MRKMRSPRDRWTDNHRLVHHYMKKRGAEPNDKIVGISNSLFLSEDEARKLPRRAQKKTGMPQLSFHLTLAKR